jgi:RNA polymerase sigma-70 factor (ECF subfamily)
VPSPLTDSSGDPGGGTAAAANQAALLESLFRAHHRDVYAMVYRFVRSRAVAEEVVQDAFLRVWDQRDRWGDTQDLAKYLFTVARNRAISLLRRERVELTWRQRVDRGQLTSGVSQFSIQAGREHDTSEATERLLQAIAKLPARARDTLLLRIHRQLKNSEIAEVMGISVKGVERNLTRAIEVLRKALT